MRGGRGKVRRKRGKEGRKDMKKQETLLLT
jgi:hypothetical protein